MGIFGEKKTICSVGGNGGRKSGVLHFLYKYKKHPTIINAVAMQRFVMQKNAAGVSKKGKPDMPSYPKPRNALSKI